MAEKVQAVTGESVKLAFVDQGYTGEAAQGQAAEHGMRLEVVKLSEAQTRFCVIATPLS